MRNLSGARQGAPESIEESASLLRLVFDHANEGISVFDEQLRLTAWNRRFVSLTRLDPAVVHRGATLHELLLELGRAGEFGDVDVDAEATRRLELLSRGPAEVSERTRADGRTIELSRSPVPGGGFVMRYADVTERKAAQATVADQQRMLSLLIERTEQGIWFIDNELCTTQANPAMCRMLGLSLDQLMGRNIYEFVDEANEALFREHVARRSQGQAEAYEIALLHSDGHLVYCFNNATPIHDAQGHKIGAVGMFSDISKLKRAEQQIRHTGGLLEQKSHVLEVTLDSLSQGVLSFDAQGRSNAYNRQLLELLEMPEALLQQRPTMSELMSYQFENGLIARPADAALSAPWIHPYQRTRSDGRVLEVLTHAADDGSVVRTYTDVTVQVQAQHALQESESRFRSMADAAPALIWLTAAYGRALWFNQRWLKYTGLTLEAELARGWKGRLHPDDDARCRAAFTEAARLGTQYREEFRILHADGSAAWIEGHSIPRSSSEGAFDGFIVYGWDITERKAVREALLAAKEEAERANRAKSEFLSRMSHELRTPLNAVLGFAQLMQADAQEPLGAAQSARVQELMRGGRHLLSLINDVLDLARIEAGALHLQLEPVTLASLVQECAGMVRTMASERGIAIEIGTDDEADADTQSSRVMADPTRLKQVLLNLLSNAIKYNREGGKVQLSWRATAQGELLIEVSDEGPGLSESQQDRLFNAFERLDAAHSSVEGAGIGLALSKWLVELMQGRIGVRSVQGQGSVFWISLSACAPGACGVAGDTPVPVAAAPVLRPAVQRPRSVLYIEDNEVNQLLMEGMLAQRPHLQLHIAGLPLHGLEMAAQLQPDLVLLDIQLPGIDGFEVLRRLRAQPALARIPVVAVSANAMPSDSARAEQAGFADYVTKPVDLLRLLAVVDRWLAD